MMRAADSPDSISRAIWNIRILWNYSFQGLVIDIVLWNIFRYFVEDLS
jgi:hypothetical protein